MGNIFEIKSELLNIFNNIEENEGEITPEIEEALKITQDEFKDKVKSYCELIKILKNDISLVDAETKRLAEVKKSKQNIIDRLSGILTDAIDEFGDITKSGGKFIDYGIGKVSVRNTKKVDVNEDYANSVVNAAIARFGYLEYTKQLDTYDCVNVNQFTEDIKNDTNYIVSEDDLNAINANISFSIPLGKLMKGEGYKFMKDFVKYTNLTNYKTKPSVDKTFIKENADSDFNGAKIVNNKTIQIK